MATKRSKLTIKSNKERLNDHKETNRFSLNALKERLNFNIETQNGHQEIKNYQKERKWPKGEAKCTQIDTKRP